MVSDKRDCPPPPHPHTKESPRTRLAEQHAGEQEVGCSHTSAFAGKKPKCGDGVFGKHGVIWVDAWCLLLSPVSLWVGVASGVCLHLFVSSLFHVRLPRVSRGLRRHAGTRAPAVHLFCLGL